MYVNEISRLNRNNLPIRFVCNVNHSTYIICTQIGIGPPVPNHHIQVLQYIRRVLNTYRNYVNFRNFRYLIRFLIKQRAMKPIMYDDRYLCRVKYPSFLRKTRPRVPNSINLRKVSTLKTKAILNIDRCRSSRHRSQLSLGYLINISYTRAGHLYFL